MPASRERTQSPPPSEPVTREIDDQEDMEVDMAVASPASVSQKEAEGGGKESNKPSCSSASRKSTGRKPKTKPLTYKQRAVAEVKLRDLADLDCQPFVPTSVDFDVSKHEKVLHLLGLWDFANLRLDREVRKDLILELIAYYDQANRRTCVKGMRVHVTRIELARALGLPEKKAYPSEVEESDRETFEDQGTKTALGKFLLGWVVLVGEVGIVPNEGQEAIRLIESGRANKVDWASLLCGMVHREIQDAPKSRVCCYASHLQQLMRHQRPLLFEEEKSSREVPVAEEEEEEEDEAMPDAVGVEKGENVGNAEPEKVEKEFQVATITGLDPDDDGNVEQAQQQQWLLGRRNELDEHCLRPCSNNNVQSGEFGIDAIEGEHEMNNETCEDDFTSKFPNEVNSTDLLEGMSTDNVSFIPSLQQPVSPSPGEFLASPIEARKSAPLNYSAPGSSLFGNDGKRPGAKIDGEGEDGVNENQNFSQGDMAKRLRTDESWHHTPSACMEQAINWLEKARLVSGQKEQDILNAQMQLQYLTDLVQQKDHIIQSLERSRLEDQHRMQLELSQFEHERMVMSHMVVGYQKALKRTRQTFSEYREKFPQGDEPLYKDVPGPGGVVLTVREIERLHLEKLESEKQVLEKKVLENNKIIQMLHYFSMEWSGKFETHEDEVCQLANRLENLFGRMKLPRDHIVENKHSDEIKTFKEHLVQNKHSGEMDIGKDHITENKQSGEMELIVKNEHSDEKKLLKDQITEKEQLGVMKPVGDDP